MRTLYLLPNHDDIKAAQLQIAREKFELWEVRIIKCQVDVEDIYLTEEINFAAFYIQHLIRKMNLHGFLTFVFLSWRRTSGIPKWSGGHFRSSYRPLKQYNTESKGPKQGSQEGPTG